MKPKDKKATITRNQETQPRPAFVTRYCPKARKVFRIIQRYWSSLYTDHVDIRKYIKNKPRLTFRSKQSLARKLVTAKLKKPYKRHNKQHDRTNNSNSSNCSSNNSSSNPDTSRNNSTQNDSSLTNITRLADNIDIGLKISTTKCNDLNCPLHGRLSAQTRSDQGYQKEHTLHVDLQTVTQNA